MGAKIKTQAKSIGLPTKCKEIPGPKINPPNFFFFHVCKIGVILRMAAEVLNYYWYLGLCIEILYVCLMNF